jgi:hypothetical protein
VRVAAHILKLLQFAENRAASRITQHSPKLIQGGDFVLAEELSDILELIFGCLHNEHFSPLCAQCQG